MEEIDRVAEAMFNVFSNGAGTVVPMSWRGLSKEQRAPWREQAAAAMGVILNDLEAFQALAGRMDAQH